ncbi:MAG: SH3 domain-containing protein [Bauldia sp.]|nr:SH3 domain-containing protein [Bauldia sp.]
MDSSYARRERSSAAFEDADDVLEGRRDDGFAVFDAIAADIASEVDLVDELERILRGEVADEDSEPVSLPPAVAAEAEAALVHEGRQAAIPAAVDLDALDEGEVGPDEVPAGFWQSRPARPAEAPLRARRAPRTDLIVMASLAVVVLGLGTFAALGGWGGAQPVAGIEAAAAAEAIEPGDAALADAGALAPPATDEAAFEAETPPAFEPTPPAVDPAFDPSYAAPPLDPADLLGAVSGEELAVSASPDGLALVEPKEEARVPESEPLAAAPQTLPPAARDPGIGGPIELMPETPGFEPAAVETTPPAGPRPAAPAQTEIAPLGDTATVTSAVNMRGGPDNGAPVLGVVPQGSVVEVVACAYWCEVTFNGQSGWIYRDFLRMR